MGFQKILVAIDGSPQATAVFEQALELATKESASLMVFHGIELGTRLTYPSQIETKTEQAKELLQQYQQEAKDRGIATESSYRVGGAGGTICDAAQSWGADLIVLGRRGYKGLTEALLGSVSGHVVRHAPCSVLVVQGKASAAR